LAVVDRPPRSHLILRLQPSSDPPTDERQRRVLRTLAAMGKANDLSRDRHPFAAARLGRVVTDVREYAALHGVASLSLLQPLLNPQPAAVSASASANSGGGSGPGAPPTASSAATTMSMELLQTLPAKFRSYLVEQLNASQLRAVLAAASSSSQHKVGFTLLQGPPGTGKTKTVVTLLNVLHLERFLQHYNGLMAAVHARLRHALAPPDSPIAASASASASSSAPAATLSLDDIISTQARTVAVARGDGPPPPPPKPRILVCAPSNAGVDEIVARVLGMGLMDGERRRYKPDMVRVGRSMSIRREVTDVSLDTFVDRLFKLDVADLRRKVEDNRRSQAQADTAIKQFQDFIKAKKTLNPQYDPAADTDIGGLIRAYEDKQRLALEALRYNYVLDCDRNSPCKPSRVDLRRL
jgi:hypothetical protein